MSKSPNELLSAAAIAERAVPYGSASYKNDGRIYFLLRQGEVVYVGQTILPVVQRVSMHSKDKEFDSWHWIPCPIQSLAETERAYIAALKPALNIRLNLARIGPLTGTGLDRPMTVLERQNRWRERQADRDRLMQEAVQFVRALRPDTPVPDEVTALQQALRAMLAAKNKNC